MKAIQGRIARIQDTVRLDVLRYLDDIQSTLDAIHKGLADNKDSRSSFARLMDLKYPEADELIEESEAFGPRDYVELLEDLVRIIEKNSAPCSDSERAVLAEQCAVLANLAMIIAVEFGDLGR